ncbi:MAG: DegT/DnrJ/EryC1/StrS family aminotransferase [Deltaproteobacteria bacterium]|nr:DegT/DnrJ/EryC1/StrS family aminotransferase [Deltaproteobacteria bacterium]
MRIPQLDLKAQYETLRGEIDAAIRRVLEEQRFILGPEVEAFEREVADYVGTAHAVGVSSCSDALLMSLLALGVGPGDEVITTCYSFIATAEAIARTGAKPVFVDIDPATYQLDVTQVAARTGGRTRALLPVHLFGRCAPVEELRRLAPELAIVEDVAQSMGAERLGSRAGSLGRLGCFSFFPSKNLGGYGDGGMVTTDDPALAERLRSLRQHGQAAGKRHEHHLVGGNFRLDALQAAILRVKLRHLEDWTVARRRVADHYRRLVAELAVDVTLPPEDAPDCRDVYNQFVIRTPNRDALVAHLASRGIGSAIYYPLPLHLQGAMSSLDLGPGAFPHAERAARECLALPMYPELTIAQIEEIVRAIAEFLGGG